MAAPNPAARYARVQLRYDAELNRVLEHAARDIRSRIASMPLGVGGKIRSAQLTLVLDEIHTIQESMWQSGVINNVVTGRKAAATAAQDAVEAMDRVLYASLPESVADIVRGGLRSTAMAGIEADAARAPRALSARVYHDFALTSGQVERTIRAGIVQGLSARELSATVYQYISPTTPGGASYAATRLARTEINNAFHEQQIRGGQRPGITASVWNLSGSHKRPDDCNKFAIQNVDDLGAGRYRPNNVPGKPHPQCLCFITYDTMDPEQFAKAIQSGKFDDQLDSRIKANLERLGKPTTSTVAPIPKKTMVTTPKPSLSVVQPARESVTRINKLSGVNRDAVSQALEYQAEILPSAMERLREVRMMTPAEQAALGRQSIGGYVVGENRMVISKQLFTDKYERAFAKELKTNYSSRCGVDHNHVDGLIGHEFGHHVASSLEKAPSKVKLDFWKSVANDFGIPKPFFADRTSLDRWVSKNHTHLVTNVSKYGATESDELLAEIWLEYSTNPDARPAIKAIGERMKAIAEEWQ